ncbi:MAG TPA: sigma-70 family RNA polymerase sigma factor [Thermoanaerobaculia bacterium]|nr:sigma-70 family RNA polymerase sigma factor [Thermoanaerobaculia bacterium]
MKRDPDTAIGRGSGRFPTTRRSAVLAATSEDREERTRALDLLVTLYWRPVYRHLRIHWSRSNEDARDLTQGFFASAIERNVFGTYDPARGTFRTFLRTCLDRYVSNEAKAASRIKRGGGTLTVSFDFDLLESEFVSPSSAAESPEQEFHREWVRSLFAFSVDQLQSECIAANREIRFLLFERLDVDPTPGENASYADLAAEFDLPVTTVTNHLFSVRRRFREIVLECLRNATASNSEFREEARRLLGVDPP